jgi:hypothetical protein
MSYTFLMPLKRKVRGLTVLIVNPGEVESAGSGLAGKAGDHHALADELHAADADALRKVAGQLRKAAGSFATNTGHGRTCTTQAVQAPWHGNSSLAFLTSSHGVQQLSSSGEQAAATAASATTTFARVVHDVDDAIDDLNRRHNQAWQAASIAAARQPAHSTKDPYRDANALDAQLEKQYEDQITKYNTAAGTYAHALSASDMGDLWKLLSLDGKNPPYPVKWALRSLAGALGQTSSGFTICSPGCTAPGA